MRKRPETLYEIFTSEPAPPQQYKKVCVMCRLDPDVKECLDNRLKEDGYRLQDLLETFIKGYIKKK